VVSAASFKAVVPIAPGGMITIFGDRLAESTAAAQTLPLPTSLGGTELVMAGLQMPLLFVSQGQINAVVPNGININTSQQLLIRRGTTLSRPVALDVAATQPAIFSTAEGKPIVVNASATGPAPILVNDSPAGSGDVLVLYTSGLGLTTPSIADGVVSPSNPVAATKDPVSVTVGGVPAQVLFAGLVPGFAAFYQINITVPSALAAGDQLPVVLSVSGQTSPPVMMKVRH
jgi:uncharacterized protein (TIGR03437 family)